MLRILIAAVLVFSAGLASAERRVALVIGEDDYRSVRPLDNAVGDAQSIEDALQKLGFEVTLETDRDLRRMRRALDDFREDGKGADVALVFFAGHGAEIAGDNRLLPVDADASTLDALKASTLPLEEVRAAVAEVSKVGLIILDACRNDPFGAASGNPEGSSRGAVALAGAKEVKPGLGRVGKAEGILFAFSASPGETASDGADGHSPFAVALARYFATDGLEIRSVLTLVQQEVYDKSRGRQLPYVESGLPQMFFAAASADALPERERLLLAMADVTPDLRAEVESIAAAKDMPLAPLYAALITSDAEQLDARQRSAKLDEAATAFVRVREEMRTLSSDDPQVAKLRNEAEDQLALGAFDAARGKLDQAAAIDSSSRKALKANFVARTLSEAATRYVSGGASEAEGALRVALAAYQLAGDLFAELGDAPLSIEARHQQLLILQARANAQIRLGYLADAIDSVDALAVAAGGLAQAEPGDADWQHAEAVAAAMGGDLRLQLGDSAGAGDAYASSLDFARHAVALDPADAGRQRGLAVALDKLGNASRTRGDLVAAMGNYREAIEITVGLLDKALLDSELQRDLSYYDNQLGDILRTQGNYADALAAYRAALDIRRRLAEQDVANQQRKYDVGVSGERVADMLAELGDADGARALYQERQSIIAALVARSPENIEWQRDLSVSHEKLGDLSAKAGDTGGALEAYRASQAIAARLSDAQPSNAYLRRDVATISRKVGEMLLADGDADGALAIYRDILVIAEALAEGDPANLELQFDLATAHNRLGGVETGRGERESGLAHYRASRTIIGKLAETDPSNADWQWNLFASNYQLAEAGDDPVTNYQTGLAILERLEAGGQLSPSRKTVIEEVRNALEAARKHL